VIITFWFSFDFSLTQPVAAGLAYTVYRLYTRSVCDTTAPLQLQLPLVALYKCYAFNFLYLYIYSFRIYVRSGLATHWATVTSFESKIVNTAMLEVYCNSNVTL